MELSSTSPMIGFILEDSFYWISIIWPVGYGKVPYCHKHPYPPTRTESCSTSGQTIPPHSPQFRQFCCEFTTQNLRPACGRPTHTHPPFCRAACRRLDHTHPPLLRACYHTLPAKYLKSSREILLSCQFCFTPSVLTLCGAAPQALLE